MISSLQTFSGYMCSMKHCSYDKKTNVETTIENKTQNCECMSVTFPWDSILLFMYAKKSAK